MSFLNYCLGPIIVSLILCTSCQPGLRIGTVENDIYHNQLFSVPVPQLGWGMTMYDTKITPEQYVVRFQNDAGSLLQYEVVDLREAKDSLYGAKDENLGRSYKDLMYQNMIEEFLVTYPKTTILKDEKREIENIGYSRFVIFDIPMAEIFGASPDKPSNLIKGHLMTFCDDTLVVVSTQVSALDRIAQKMTGAESPLNEGKMLEKLIEARLGYKMISSNKKP